MYIVLYYLFKIGENQKLCEPWEGEMMISCISCQILH